MPKHALPPNGSPTLSHRLLHLSFKAGLFDALHSLWPFRLTVLAYHRIADLHTSDFDTFKPNVSATPAAFAAQMDFMQARFNIISIGTLLAWLQGKRFLPPNPALITFDDGYRDNFDYALPVLQQRNRPAVIFLATDYIGQAAPFYWDLIAYCFFHTTRDEADLPLLGPQRWDDEHSRTTVMDAWLARLKQLPDNEKWGLVRQLPQILGVSITADTFAGLHLTWEQVRTLVAAGVDMGAHTQSHPILTRVSLAQAQLEVRGSKARLEAEINQPVTSFAYPNGLPTDFNPTLQAVLAQTGFEAAFTLVSGPAHLPEVRREPMAIRRVFVHHKDSLSRFAAKVMGLPRVVKRLG